MDRTLKPAVAMLAALAVACSSASPPSSSSPVGTGGTPTVPPVSAPAPTAATTPRPMPTVDRTLPEPYATPVHGGEPFDISWSPTDGRDVPAIGGSLSWPYANPWSIGSVRWGSGTVVVYETEAALGPMIWWSPDLASWRRVVPAGPAGRSLEVRQIFVGGPGLVAFGYDAPEDGGESAPVMWLSTDGEVWSPTTGLPPIANVWARPGTIVGFGEDTWLSSDGRTWRPAGPSPFAGGAVDHWMMTRWVEILDDGDSAIVFLHPDVEGPTEVFRLTADGHWRQLAELDGEILLAARGPRGYVALGYREEHGPTSWVSGDGIAWDASVGPEDARTLIDTPAGYVATSQRSYFAGCAGFDPAEQVAQTWTSGDGITWRRMPEDPALDHVDLPLLILEGDRLLALGLKWAVREGSTSLRDRATASVWQSQPFEEPQDHTPPTAGPGCGQS